MKRTFFVTVHTMTGFNVEVEDNSDDNNDPEAWGRAKDAALTLAKEKHPGLRWTSDGEDIEEVI
jgi:hypothetical protein